MTSNRTMRILRGTGATLALLTIALGAVLPFKAALAANAGDCTAGTPGCDYVPLTTLPGAFEAGKVANPVNVVKNIYGVSIGIAAILAVGMIIWAGVEYATTESIQGHSGAKEKWQGAIWGLLLLLASFIILRTINVDLVNIDLDLGKPLVGNTLANENALSEVAKAANDSVIALKQAEQDAQDQQKKTDDLQSKVDEAHKKLEGLNLATEEGRKLVAEAAELENQLEVSKQQALASAESLQMQKISTAAAQGDLQITQALAKGDVSLAQEKFNNLIRKIDQEIATLQSLGATEDVVNKAIVKKISIEGSNKQEIYLAGQVKTIETSRIHAVTVQNAWANASEGNTYSSSYDLSKDKATQQKIIQARQGLTSQYNSTARKIQAVDSAQVQPFNQESKEQLAAFDERTAKIIGCPKGIDVYSTSVSCRK